MVGGVSYATPAHLPAEYNRAGAALVDPQLSGNERDEAMDLVSNFRSAHSHPLNEATLLLLARSKRVDGSAFVSNRLKRMESIERKLRDLSSTRLTQMQDIGGCRAVLKDVVCLKGLIELVLSGNSSGNFPHFTLKLKKDYIVQPKDNGYRSIHIVGEYTGHPKAFRGLKIEIQIRTRLQHLWATAVEVCQFFSGQRFKSESPNADKRLVRFFALASGKFAMKENTDPVPGVISDDLSIRKEMAVIDSECKITASLSMWSRILYVPPFPEVNGYFYVMDLRSTKGELTQHDFAKNELPAAEELYLRLEKDADGDATRQVVLVSVDSLQQLREAYPNYFADTHQFIAAAWS
jgi:ppGpp synthetase/RelA/SpoT-type nucleotidyltranferase